MSIRLVIILLLLGLVVSSSTITAVAQTANAPVVQTQTVTHIVRPGETLYSLARRYGTTVEAIAQANGLTNVSQIYSGQRLIIPLGSNPALNTYVVRGGDTLFSIGRQFGVDPYAIARANGILNPNRIYPGQRLVIPGGTGPYPTPIPGSTPVPTATLPPGPSTQESIVISAPVITAIINSPVTVSGIADPTFEQHLAIRVRDQSGAVVGQGTAIIQADVGQRGPYSTSVTFTVPSGTQAGRIEVYAVSPRDGNLTHLSSVEVQLQAP
ncbi:MAG: LysM peptidoglycan-binding domain-containing protein [Chloroflexi bacterium]|nr:LysM peptidoglycan-binding domain-containing protein [Chloroflexota bacterium]